MQLKYISTRYYYGNDGSPLSSMTQFGAGIMPVIIAESDAEYKNLSGKALTEDGESLASAFLSKTGFSPNDVTIPAFFVDESSFLGYSYFGAYMPLPNLIGFPTIPGNSIICAFDNYYYRLGLTYANGSGTSLNDSAELRNTDGSTIGPPQGLPISGAYNNTKGNRAQCQIMLLRRIDGNIDLYSDLRYDLTPKGSYLVVAQGSDTNLLNILNNIEYIDPVAPDNDPYNSGGSSGTGGGTGSFDGTGDNIDIPNLPTLSAVDAKFITLFNPSIEQLHELSNYMWSNGFDIGTFKKLFADPMDCILGLSIVPVAVPNGESSTVSVGNISTGISMTKAATQYVTVDCGTLNVNEYWGAYLDYDPYTKAEIYLPYIGTHALSVDDIMGKSVHVVYHVDILSGACAAYVKCGGSVLYTFIGQCSSSIPINGNDWTNVINGVLSIAGAVGSMVATGGASAPMAAGMIASTAVNGMKPNVEKSGSMSGTGGMLGIQTPFLILTRPRQALPARQNKFTGYPSFITEKLGDLSGYTEIEEIHLENISATESELSEIENLLKSGVIF